MNARLAKEIRPLLLPWCIAAFTAAGYIPALVHSSFADGEFGSFLVGLSSFALVGGVLLLSALPMGFELQNCTLTTLLSQPMDRTRLWREKLNAATLSGIALGIVHGLASAAAGQLSLSVALLFGAFIVTAICSVGSHTLASGSIIVGIASAVATPWAIALGAYLFAYYVLRLQTEPSEKATLALVLGAAAVYSAISLWLARRQFMRLELKDAPAARGAQIPEVLVPKRLIELFRAQSTRPVWNLISKEVCLQKPIFLVSAIFTACWLSMLLLMALRPAWQDDLVGVLHGLTGAQVVLMVILTGCVALGDDKALGTTAWHLTLPISIRRQWAIKLLVSAATLFGMAVVLPGILSALTLFKTRVGLLALRPEDMPGMAIAAALVFLVGFWSGYSAGNTIRSALMTMLSLVLLGSTVAAAIQTARHGGGIQSPLAAWFITTSQLSVAPPVLAFVMLAFVLGIVFLALFQSYQSYRRLSCHRGVLFRQVGLLLGVVFAATFWTVDFSISANRAYQAMIQDVQAALQAVQLDDTQLTNGRSLTLSSADLATSANLSSATSRWLRDSTFRIVSSPGIERPLRPRFYVASLHFPNGEGPRYLWTFFGTNLSTTNGIP